MSRRVKIVPDIAYKRNVITGIEVGEVAYEEAIKLIRRHYAKHHPGHIGRMVRDFFELRVGVMINDHEEVIL